MSTDGGRFDVDVIDRTRAAVYWDELTTEVRRCSWFYRPEGETRFVPYPEQLSDKLEVRPVCALFGFHFYQS